ncbi:hypothetical protein GZH47_24815 [Paenibacillus rhizovicinus]|uniref:Polysaccharide deacetylase family protein n=1 Tax=Paenibacillus rhizovicinus TaxID=2704463 RepID=A0A6C0P587_9BACL|nr:hypothetical protein [Paenibacillus rhizovicinus]QHW33700.1 hypothetical protein GZH47_24815 [Paenibacillus rhizovicinus]
MANIKVLFWFDVEDYTTPESMDGFRGLIDLCDSRGIQGIFKLVGEKARMMVELGRQDIIEKLRNHEVGYHTDYHSVHPTISEYLEHMGFKDGAERFDREEYAGLKDVERITGMPNECYGQPGGAWAPQAFPAILKWGVPVYLDNHEQVTLNSRPYWYGGLLNFMELTGFMRMELVEDGLETAKQEFDAIYEKLSSEPVGFVSIVYHPNEFNTPRFWDDVNFARGKNPPRSEWQPASPLRPPGEMEKYLAMLGEFLDYILSRDNVEFITSAQARELERSSKGELSEEQVRKLAEDVDGELYFKEIDDYSLSASDTHSLFSRYLLDRPLAPELIYGPETEVASGGSPVVTVRALKQAIAEPYPDVFGYKQLPDTFKVGEASVNPVDLTCTLAKVIRDGLTDEDEVAVVRGRLRSQQHAKDDDFWGKGWIIFPEDFRVPNIVRMSKLQTWTLKPALF